MSVRVPRVSAGVVVVRRVGDDWRFLLLRAFNHWDFPKGMVEAGEQPIEAAVREVREETPAGTYRVGMRVVHPMFGVGTVRLCDRSGKDEKLVVHFQRAGVKKLVARFARLEIV